jgi:hypothetical protein
MLFWKVVSTYKIIRCHKPEDHNPHTHYYEILKYYMPITEQMEGLWGLGAEESVWTEGGASNRSLEKN